MKSIMVPQSFIHPLFYQEGDVVSSKSDLFYYDMMALLNEREERPWERGSETPFKVFQNEKEGMRDLFRQRKKEDVKELMKSSIGQFITFLFWMNHSPIPGFQNFSDHVASLKIKPFNVTERLFFIMQKPNQYVSYMQLDELFTEANKQAKVNAIIKRK